MTGIFNLSIFKRGNMPSEASGSGRNSSWIAWTLQLKTLHYFKMLATMHKTICHHFL